jgi:hypothetical protein
VSPEDRKLAEGNIRGLLQMIRAWQDWLKSKAHPDPTPQEPRP